MATARSSPPPEPETDDGFSQTQKTQLSEMIAAAVSGAKPPATEPMSGRHHHAHHRLIGWLRTYLTPSATSQSIKFIKIDVLLASKGISAT